MTPEIRSFAWRTLVATLILVTACAGGVLAADFSVTPVRADLRAGALTETITVANDAPVRLRVAVRLFEWTQDSSGKDVYTENSDLVYFPRQLEIEPNTKRLIRVGAKSPATTTEKTYRLFIEEIPEPQTTPGARAQVAISFRFGVPVFLPPAAPRLQAEVGEPTLDKGKFSVVVRNPGNLHFRLDQLTLTDGAGYTQEIAGWYSLPGTERSYTAAVPVDICRRTKALTLRVEGEGVKVERKLNVDPASCS